MKLTGDQLPLDEDITKVGVPLPAGQDPVGALERVAKDLRGALNALRGLRNLAKDLSANADKVRALLPRAKAALDKLPGDMRGPAEHWIASLNRSLDDHDARIAKSFASDLDVVLRAKGIKLGGNLPLLEASFFKLEVGAQDVHVWFGPQRETAGTVPKSAPAVAEFIEQTRARLASDPLDDERFVDQVYRAYRSVLAISDAGPGSHAKVDAVHRQLIVARQERGFTQSQKLRAYCRMQFGYDLYRTKQRMQKGRELQLVTAPRSQTVKHADSLWVPTDDAGKGFLVSHIVFKEE